jgi:S1-C subfamily serine protease
MEEQKNELWEGGPWEQPHPVFPDPPRVRIPQKRKQQQPRRSRRRHWIAFGVALVLIAGLTGAVIFWPRQTSGESSEWEMPSQAQETSQSGSTATYLPQAETGTGVTVTVSPLPEETLTYAQVYEKNEQSIVTIHAMDQDGLGQGTGIVLTADGYIITNAHVVEGAVQAVVVLNDDTYYEASLVGISTEEDLAVLKIQAQDLVPAEFGDSTLLRVGDEVCALGNPLGYRMTLTAGIISAVDRKMEMDGSTMYLLQTSAAINFGNSGGALLNDRGQVVGVTAVKIVSDDGSAEALGFAIPTERVKYVVDQLIAGEEIRTPVLGITVENRSGVTGVTVTEIQDWSDASAQGLQVGDVIVGVNGKTVSVFRDLQRVKDLQKVGDSLLLQVERNGQTLEISVRLEDEAAHSTDG